MRVIQSEPDKGSHRSNLSTKHVNNTRSELPTNGVFWKMLQHCVAATAHWQSATLHGGKSDSNGVANGFISSLVLPLLVDQSTLRHGPIAFDSSRCFNRMERIWEIQGQVTMRIPGQAA